ncbi:conserved hypothetical protein [Sporisorium reilianum SRZ2]|uniref:Secreted protein n=1 Tax=Sporisorium reilianum (strain SRZ2) TaxID=999809 RepID=E6ZSR7_SPORE|nr:conserved hypothetical protein [Sporisorium reilianum SRZ2]
MKLSSSFAALSSVILIAICIGQAQADTVTTPLGLTQVDDKGVPITPLTYLNLAPASKELAGAAKKITTPPPLMHEKRLLPTDHLEPVVEQFTSQGISIKRESLLPSLPLLGSLDNEGDYSNVRKRLLDFVKSLEPGPGTEYLPENHQQLSAQHTVHPLNRRGEEPVDVNVLGQKLPKLELPAKLAGSKHGKSSGLNLMGYEIPLDEITLPGASKRDSSPVDLGLKADNKEGLDAVKALVETLVKTTTKRDDSPVDLGLKTGNQQDLDSIKSLLGGLVPAKREDDAPVKPLDLGLQTGNAQDLERAKSLLASLLGGAGKRDTISPDKIDLGSVQALGEAAAAQGAKSALPLAFAPVRQAASPAVQGIKAVNSICNAFDCYPAIESAVEGVKNDIPLPLPRSLGDKDLLANGLLHQGGQVNGIPVRKRADPVVETVLNTSDDARDAILGVKDAADNAAGAFVKNMYTKHGQVQQRDLNVPGFSLLPGTGPGAKAIADEIKEGAQEAVEFVGLPLPGVRRMERVRRK